MTIFKQAISEHIWQVKYRYNNQQQVIDHAIEDTWQRVSKAVAKVEKNSHQTHWQREFYGILETFRYLPGGRILAGAGTSHTVTLFNCFVMNIAEDSLTGIFDALREGALTLQQGGGVGYDFSVLRPYGDLVKKTGIPASGPVSFMRIWDTTCAILLSTGARRGAMMGVMRCDHPDIEAFITAKSDPRELRHFNVSVMVSDEFMTAVRGNKKWALVFPAEENTPADEIVYRRWGNHLEPVACRIHGYVNAKELWNKIIRSAYDYAEPGVLFGDTINRLNTLWYCEQINATNPCGEIPLPAYGACNLGAINLTQFVQAPFTANAKLDWTKIEETIRIATRFQDNIVDVSNYPLFAQREYALSTRRIGLGLTGLADTFLMLGIKYGSKESLVLASDISKKLAETTWQTSIELAKEKGAFSRFRPEYLQGEFVQTLDESLQQALAKWGVRNSHHNTIAPTGTTSLLANNVSNGIEPIFRAEYDRYIRTVSGEFEKFHAQDYAVSLWQENNKNLPPAFIDTQSLTPESHLQIQAAMQPFIDNAISKTINIPQDFPFDKLEQVYTQAYELGLKGCTIFRPNPVTGSVLVAKEDECDHCYPREEGT